MWLPLITKTRIKILVLSALLLATAHSGYQWFLELNNAEVEAVYAIDNSLRFNDNDSANLSRTFGSAGNRKTWTWSGWVKRSNLTGSSYPHLFRSLSGDYTEDAIRFHPGEVLQVYMRGNDPKVADIQSSAVFRDTSAWMHVLVSVDTTQSTAANRVKIYIDGSQLTDFGTETYPTQNYDSGINSAIAHYIGTRTEGGEYLDGYLADVYFIDGQALSPSDFGAADANSYWRPIEYDGTYGTNGFHLDFANSSDLGNDVSGNNNDWTANNLDATDQTIDTPTNSFATLNPLNKPSQPIISNGLLDVSAGTYGSNFPKTQGTFLLPNSGKYYYEAQAQLLAGGGNAVYVGFDYATNTPSNNDVPDFYYNYSIFDSSISDDEYIRVAVDMDAGLIWYGDSEGWENGDPAAGSGGASFNNEFELVPAVTPAVNSGNTNRSGAYVNFGQNGQSGLTYYSAAGGYFKYEPPSGFKALSTKNLPSPDIDQPNQYFDALTYTGSSSAQSTTGLSFTPVLTWLKDRDATNAHGWFDSVRSVFPYLSSNSTAAEVGGYGQTLTSFNSDGFSLGSNSLFNTVDNNYISWNWKEDPTSGFDMVNYLGTGANRAISHSLGEPPEFMIIKDRGATNDWAVYHAANTTEPATDYLLLNSTAATADDATYWNDTSPGYTKLLIHADGDDASTVVKDSSLTAHKHSITAVADAQIDTAQSKFGGSSLYFDGTGDYLDIPDSSDWAYGSGDFTVDFWIRPTNPTGGTQAIFGQAASTGADATNGGAGAIFYTTTGKLYFTGYINGTFYHPAYANTVGTLSALSANTWYHVAIVRSGTSVELFLDGTSQGSISVSGAAADSAYKIALGRYGEYNGYYYTGHIDEFRISKGTARWTSDFSVPTSAHTIGSDEDVFFLGTNADVNTSGNSYTAYLFAEKDGFSKFGSYTGNGSTDGPFVYTGFKPRWLMIKRTDTSPLGWWIFDTARSTYNPAKAILGAYSNAAESVSTYDIDLLSNGLKLRTTNGAFNASGGTYVYAAFAEQPFKESAEEYNLAIDESLRFNDNDSAYLSRTQTAGSSRKTFTYSLWAKLANLSSNRAFAEAYYDASNFFLMGLGTGDNPIIYSAISGVDYGYVYSPVYRDPSKWHHFVFVVDTDNGTAADRFRLYVDGERVTAISTDYGDPTSGYVTDFLNTGFTHSIGRRIDTSTYYDGYLSDVYLIDGTATTAEAFGEYDANGYWRPKTYSGSYGTNGFHLDFANSSDLGNDVSGNNNDWTSNNLSAVDQVDDSPTDGFATLNPADTAIVGSLELRDGNLYMLGNRFGVRGTVSVSSGKWVWEMTPNALGTGTDASTCIADAQQSLQATYGRVICYRSDGNKIVDGTATAYGATYGNGDVIRAELDFDAGNIEFFKNGTSQGTINLSVSSGSGEWVPEMRASNSVNASSIIAEFGSVGFSGTPTAGFKALSTANLPAPDVVQPNLYFDALTYTGTGSGGGSQTYSSPGSFNFTVPSYDSMTVQLWGAGGGGGASGPSLIGGSNGGQSTFNSTLTAGGGYGGSGGYTGSGAGGSGGSASGGDTNTSGNSGAASTGNWYGGTGGSAPSGGGGGAGAAYNYGTGGGGTAPGGGAGGGGGYYYFDGKTTTTYYGGGGGGSGGYVSKTYSSGDLTVGATPAVVVGSGGGGGSQNSAGGTGGAGRVAITWTYEGGGTSVSGLNFTPDLVWLKDRDDTNAHGIFDSVRSVFPYLSSNSTAAEVGGYGKTLTAFNSDGFSLGTDSLFNTNTNDYVSWNWKEDPTSGMDVVEYTGTGANSAISHSLNATPSLMIIKDRSGTNDWAVYHSANTSAPETDYLLLNSTAATADDNTYWNDTAPSSTEFTIGTNADVNTSGNSYTAYLFAEKDGFSKFGSYTGNGSTDGPFVYTGFKPRFVMIKRTDTSPLGWWIFDTERSTYNPAKAILGAHDNIAESVSTYDIDLLSNGLKLRTTNGAFNASGGTYVYAAFAEQPFKYSASLAATASALLKNVVTFLMGMVF